MKFVFVTEYSKSTKVDIYEGKSITGFIRNMPLKESDVINMENYVKVEGNNLGDMFCWSKERTVKNQYISIAKNKEIPLQNGILEPVKLVPLLAPKGTNKSRKER